MTGWDGSPFAITRRRMAGGTPAVLAAGVGALAAACGPSGAVTSTGNRDLPVVTLELWGLPIDPHVQSYAAILKDWEATAPKEKIEPLWATPGPGDYLDVKIAAAIAAGTPPDLSSQLGRKVWVQAAQKWYQPIDEYMKTAKIDIKKTFFESALTPWQLQGKTYGVPLEDNAAGFGMAIRTDLYQEAGVPVPSKPYASYEEAFEAGRRLVRRQGNEVVRGAWCTSLGWLMTWVFGAMLEAGQPYFDTKTRTFTVTSPAGVAAIETIVETPVRMGLELPGVATNQSDGLLQGSEGKLAMALTNGPSLVRSARVRNLETAPHLKWLLRPLFRGPKHSFVGEAGWGVVAFPASKHQDRVAPFLVHVARPAAQKHWSVVRGCATSATPAPQDAPECKTEEFADQRTVLGLQKFDETWRYYGPLPYGRMDAAYGAVGRAGAKIRAGEISARQAAQEIDAELQRELARFDEDMARIGVSMN